MMNKNSPIFPPSSSRGIHRSLKEPKQGIDQDLHFLIESFDTMGGKPFFIVADTSFGREKQDAVRTSRKTTCLTLKAPNGGGFELLPNEGPVVTTRNIHLYLLTQESNSAVRRKHLEHLVKDAVLENTGFIIRFADRRAFKYSLEISALQYHRIKILLDGKVYFDHENFLWELADTSVNRNISYTLLSYNVSEGVVSGMAKKQVFVKVQASRKPWPKGTEILKFTTKRGNECVGPWVLDFDSELSSVSNPEDFKDTLARELLSTADIIVTTVARVNNVDPSKELSLKIYSKARSVSVIPIGDITTWSEE